MIRKARQDVPTRALTVSHQIGLGRISVKHDRLGDDAARAGACSCVDGTRGSGFSLGGVRDDGEERSEGIHLCVCVG